MFRPKYVRAYLTALLALAVPQALACQTTLKPSVDAHEGPDQDVELVAQDSIVGLVAQGSTTFNSDPSSPYTPPDNTMAEIKAHPNTYVAAVVNVTWNQLEPTENGWYFQDIDDALRNIDTYNKTGGPGRTRANPQVYAKLRVFAGEHVPPYLFDTAGSVWIKGHSGLMKVAKFWTSAYHDRWVALQNQLAATYDSRELIRQVSITSCSTSTFEPFIHPVDTTSISNLLNAGYTDAKYKSCINNALSDYSAWQHKALDFPINPFHYIDSGSPVLDNTTYPESVMTSARSALGSRLVLGQEGLNNPIDSTNQPIYNELQTLRRPIQFQFFNPAAASDSAFQIGEHYCPTQVEVWNTADAGGSAKVTIETLQMWNNWLIANQTTCTPSKP